MIQTNRTLLLKEINPDIGNILTYIYEIEEKKSLSDEDIVNIHKRLEVTSYSEFMEKFTPSIYMLLSQTFSRHKVLPRKRYNFLHGTEQ